jgi:O-methyltransferase
MTNKDYEDVLPSATYAPWLSDEQFNTVFDATREYCLVDKYRCYELWSLVRQSSKLEYGALIEIGAWRGGTGALIAKQAALSEIKDKIYLCDTFTGVVKAGRRDTIYSGGEHADTSKEKVEEIINKLMLDNTEILVGIFPEESGWMVDRQVFRFCHIDVDVYQSAKDIMEWVWPRLLFGGMIVFDDYGFVTCSGVTHLVNELMDRKDMVIIHNLNGHAILIKIAN